MSLKAIVIFYYYVQANTSKPLFPPSRLSFLLSGVRPAYVTLQRFIPLLAPEAPTALVPGAPEPRIYPRSG